MRWIRFAIGVLLALTLQSLLESLVPNAVAYFDPYIIVVVYYASGGNLTGTILAGLTAGFVQDAFSAAIFGLHAFSLTLSGYLVAFVYSRLLLRGTPAIGMAIFLCVVLGEVTTGVLLRILVLHPFDIGRYLIVKAALTTLLGMLFAQALVVAAGRDEERKASKPGRW